MDLLILKWDDKVRIWLYIANIINFNSYSVKNVELMYLRQFLKLGTCLGGGAFSCVKLENGSFLKNFWWDKIDTGRKREK